jgi:hypothetical protein
VLQLFAKCITGEALRCSFEVLFILYATLLDKLLAIKPISSSKVME